MINYTSSGMGNVNVKMPGMFKTMENLQTTAEFASNLTANICLLLAM